MGERGVVLKGGYPLRFMERLKSQEMKRATKGNKNIFFFSCLARFKIDLCFIFTQFNTLQIEKWISSDLLSPNHLNINIEKVISKDIYQFVFFDSKIVQNSITSKRLYLTLENFTQQQNWIFICGRWYLPIDLFLDFI